MAMSSNQMVCFIGKKLLEGVSPKIQVFFLIKTHQETVDYVYFSENGAGC